LRIGIAEARRNIKGHRGKELIACEAATGSLAIALIPRSTR
jgi:hypothetical protein